MKLVAWMKRFGLAALMAGGAVAMTGPGAFAQIGWTPAGEMCTAERTVSGVVVERKTCVRWKPVTQVCMKPEKHVTYQQVCRVGLRPEKFLQLVPKTTYKKVTVDKGCWKMVWCPNLVTKVVPQQTYERQVRTRQVPYRYQETVPKVVTRMVPKYTTKYVPETYHTVQRIPFHHRLPSKRTVSRPPSCSTPAPSCSAPAVVVPQTTYAPPPTPVMPTAAPTCAVPQQTAYVPTPVAPTCAVPQSPGCAVPSVYPPARTPSTYSAPPAAPSAAPTPYSPPTPEPLTKPVPEPSSGTAQSYYPSRMAPGSESWNAAAASQHLQSSREANGVGSLASLWGN